MTSEILTDSSRVVLVSADPMPPDEDAAHIEMARLIARCINTCDPEPMVAMLAEQAWFDSQSYAGPIAGRSEVAKHMRDKLGAILASDRRPVAEVGQYRNEPGVIVFQAGAFRTFSSPGVDVNGLISRIMGYTLVPHPSTARGTGERPGFDEMAHRERERARLERLRDEFAAADGPIIFRGFALNPLMALEQLEPLLRRLTAVFPDSKSSVSIHAFAGSDADEPIAEEAGLYDVTGYPAVAVEKGGTVFRGASENFSFDDIRSFLDSLVRSP